jgi:hypothetical protein
MLRTVGGVLKSFDDAQQQKHRKDLRENEPDGKLTKEEVFMTNRKKGGTYGKGWNSMTGPP